jgi:hypothetical protein
MSGVDLKVIAEALGHSTTTISRRYAHLSPTYQRNEMLKMSKMPGDLLHVQSRPLAPDQDSPIAVGRTRRLARHALIPNHARPR